MTPAHASPEQVRGDVITTASDIYVLGVLLYELLCGRRPFQLVGTSLTDMERIICEQEAVAPSAMVRRTAQESPELLADIVACRSTTPARLQKQLRGDLDNIILMAMRKDAERRYSSAEQLSADLERHLDRAAGARRPATPGSIAPASSWRVMRSPCRRPSLALLTLAAFSAVTFVQAQRIAHERDVATAERSARRTGFVVPGRAVRAVRPVREPRQSGHGARAARHRRATRQPRPRPISRKRAPRCWARSARVYQQSRPVFRFGRAARRRRSHRGSPFTERSIRRSPLRSRRWATALCEQGELDECEEHLNAALEMQQELARRRMPWRSRRR